MTSNKAIDDVNKFLNEIRLHAKLGCQDSELLEIIVDAFEDGVFDLLLSNRENIIESLDDKENDGDDDCGYEQDDDMVEVTYKNIEEKIVKEATSVPSIREEIKDEILANIQLFLEGSVLDERYEWIERIFIPILQQKLAQNTDFMKIISINIKNEILQCCLGSSTKSQYVELSEIIKKNIQTSMLNDSKIVGEIKEKIMHNLAKDIFD